MCLTVSAGWREKLSVRKPSCCCDSKRAGSDVALKEKSDCLALQTRCNISASESVLVRVMLSLSSLHQQLKAHMFPLIEVIHQPAPITDHSKNTGRFSISNNIGFICVQMCMSYFLTFSVTLYDFSLFSVCPKASDIITLKSKFSPHYIFFVVILTWIPPLSHDSILT